MIGWLIIAVATVTAAAVVWWSLKDGGIGGYSAADQTAVKRTQMDMRRGRRHDQDRRKRARWRGLEL